MSTHDSLQPMAALGTTLSSFDRTYDPSAAVFRLSPQRSVTRPFRVYGHLQTSTETNMPVSEMTALGWFHTAACMVALVAGAIQLCSEKGTAAHALRGKVYFWSMVIAFGLT